MTIGIAIPNWVKYRTFMGRLLDNISNQTILPKCVSIAMSEGEWQPDKKYPFKILVDCTYDIRGLAVNSNIAINRLDTDIVTIMHGDDLMHNQRNEILLWAFKNEIVRVVVHGFKYSSESKEDFLADRINNPELVIDCIDTVVNNCIHPISSYGNIEFMNGHITFRKEIFEKFKYDESTEWFYNADSEYTRRLVENRIFLSYIPHPLIMYFKDNTWIR